ncbi:hypothetical protein [uncultured Tateyamaria sp.]|uniref:hypothetical protein n=1 Tax=uncultured Tateyamaria sp. TaxID=455651 RepID=UPI00260EF534|nr:hypothetical protein [uncultured Tateyamaria sp.]
MSVKPETPVNVNRMINDLVHGQGQARLLVKEGGMPALMKGYGLKPEEMAAMKEPGWENFSKIGIAPVHQILLALQVSPEAKHHLSMSKFMDRYESEVLAQA